MQKQPFEIFFYHKAQKLLRSIFVPFVKPLCGKLSRISLCLYVVLSLTACFEPQEGCTDIAATNFDASADENCTDCCTYPKLQLLMYLELRAI